MENSEIAKILWEVSELLEFKSENPFKIRAYQKAARNIEGLPLSLEESYKSGGIKALKEIPGIGEAIAEHIEEIIKTGDFKKRKELLKEFPKSFLEMIEVQGIGPKTAMLLLKKRGIDSIEKLEKAIKSGALKGLVGFGEKKEQNILQGITHKKKTIGRHLLSEAHEYADLIINQMGKIKEIDQLLAAGSLRRQQETIGDIDILATSKNPEAVMHAFVKLPQVKRILAQGPTKSSVILKNEMQADIRVVDPKCFGAAAHYFTGNKLHNIKIREMAVKLGLKISEYGVFKNDKQIAGKTEEEVFESVGLSYIPPELREGSDEFEAAKKGNLPQLINYPDIRGDLHIHSTYSDGANTISEIAEFAIKMEYEYIAITDHTQSTRVARGQTAREIIKELEHIDELNSSYKNFKILKGAEVDILPDGTLDYKDELLKELDVVVAAVHSRFKMKKDDMTKRICTAMKNKYVNIISHPTGRIIRRRPPYELDMEEILKTASDTGTYLELNSQPDRLDLSDVNCRRAKEMGILIAINTDAHTKETLYFMQFGVSTARRGWLEAKNVINTNPIAKLMKLLYAKR
ncbi:MAG: DNA polymerase (family X) [Candidatus Saganbacteria bacterium]|uniref:DNA polymerase beta n=1 Tax=Candidatus Saganbacteria bacterium TaxID=2575572 RepID=A0A833KZI9_UNCSA|nr:MAG: DNA polymerase (family X) [Candidatus Saganbacteria bacterium]